MTQPSHEDVERLLWFVYDQCHSFVGSSQQRTVTTQENFDRLFLVLADLALALAGGYREGGLRQ